MIMNNDSIMEILLKRLALYTQHLTVLEGKQQEGYSIDPYELFAVRVMQRTIHNVIDEVNENDKGRKN